MFARASLVRIRVRQLTTVFHAAAGLHSVSVSVRVIQKEGKHTDLRTEVFDLEAVSGGNARVLEFLVVVVERELLVERRDPLPRHLEL